MKYLGIDIGDGESAITVVSSDGAVVPTVIPLGNAKSIRSIVGDLNGEPIVGDNSILDTSVTNRSARFKSRFLTDTAARDDIRRFAKGLYKLMRDSVGDDELNIALGCPANWNPQARTEYASIITSAGFSNVHTVSESRAAYLYAHYSKEMGLDKTALAKSTLVIDIGSSTLDYAYIVNGKEHNVGVFGENHLGGGILDGLILSRSVERSSHKQQIRDIFEKYPSWRNYCEITARTVKEFYFSNETDYAEKECRDSTPIYAGTDILTLTFGLSAASVNELINMPIDGLGGISFREALRQSLENAKEKTAAYPVEQVILTGGASRMKFFKEMCEEVFEGAVILECREPEFSIARGLGYAARLDDMLKRFRDEVNVYFNTGAVKKEVDSHLSALLKDYVPLVCKVLRKKKWMEELINCPVNPADQNALHDFLKEKATDLFTEDPNLMAKADALVNDWIGQHMAEVQIGLDSLCNTYKIEKADMSLVEIHNSIRIDTIKTPSLVRFLWGERKSGWIRKLFRTFGIGKLLIDNAMNASITAQLKNPQGEFAQALALEIKTQLLAQIDEQIKKVEFNI